MISLIPQNAEFQGGRAGECISFDSSEALSKARKYVAEGENLPNQPCSTNSAVRPHFKFSLQKKSKNHELHLLRNRLEAFNSLE